ncbi:diaminopimelate epimerase [Maricaulis salignorans]|uniref:Diaminopimelate epimerase n=1 Tax=Maricaulis salignorans TaxID=144026 RepID=A0A1G9SUA2_9PROT|nr:diaminopimelate epimerase [Maricaulis salignorans]SDM39059.1 diaminopimelate epimerase [Maricaulis salignorans]
MNGAGNAFLLVDARGNPAPTRIAASRIREWARRWPFDQLLVLETSDRADVFMRIWNADGDEVGACGNGTRAAAWQMMVETGRHEMAIDTRAGVLLAGRKPGREVSVDMGVPRLDWRDIPLARPMDTISLDFRAEVDGVRIENPGAVNMGNPHAVFFVRDLEALPVAALGREVEFDPVFPERVNAGFAQIHDPEHIRLRVWERGAGLTPACGTGACAALVAAHRRGLAGRSARISADGGELFVEWRESDGHVILTGPVEDEGEIELEPWH